MFWSGSWCILYDKAIWTEKAWAQVYVKMQRLMYLKSITAIITAYQLEGVWSLCRAVHFKWELKYSWSGKRETRTGGKVHEHDSLDPQISYEMRTPLHFCRLDPALKNWKPKEGNQNKLHIDTTFVRSAISHRLKVLIKGCILESKRWVKLWHSRERFKLCVRVEHDRKWFVGFETCEL